MCVFGRVVELAFCFGGVRGMRGRGTRIGQIALSSGWQVFRIAFLTAEGARALGYVGRVSWRRTAASQYLYLYIHIVMFITCIHHLLVSESYTLVVCNTTYAQPPSPHHHDPSGTSQRSYLSRIENTKK